MKQEKDLVGQICITYFPFSHGKRGKKRPVLIFGDSDVLRINAIIVIGPIIERTPTLLVMLWPQLIDQ